MMVPAEQSFVPVITGGDVGAYSLAREFHEAYGVVSAVVPTAVNRNLKHSRILEAFPAGPMTEEEPAVRALLEVADELDARVPGRPLLLLASYDHLVRFAARHRDALQERGYTVPYPDEDALDAAALKENFYALCQRLGVPYPDTAAYDAGAHTSAGLEAFLGGLRERDFAFPAILKAGDGGAWAHVRFAGRRKVHVVQDPAALRELVGKACEAGYRGSLIAQELVPGPDSQLGIATFFRDGSGQTRLVSYGEVILEDHAPGTEGNARAVLAGADATVARQGQALLEALDWRGFAMFDVKVDPRDGAAQFLEMNPRLGRNHYYLTAAGVNPAPYLLGEYLPEVAAAVGGPVPDTGRVTTTGPVLTTTVPMSLVRAHASAPQREAIRRAARAGRVVRPFEYRADRDLRRLAALRLAELNSLRAFRAFPAPRPAPRPASR